MNLRMLALREEVLEDWVKNVREAVPQTKNLLHPVLIDTLPAYYDQIANSLSDEYPGLYALVSTSIPAEHGGERARLTDYDCQALISEYHIFRKAIFDITHTLGVNLSHQETLVINAWIDMGIRESVKAFFMVQSAFREQNIAGLTHDLRDPLSTAMMEIELIMLTDDSTKIKHYASKVKEHLSRMNGMISQLLNSMMFNKSISQSIDINHFDILDLMNEVLLDAITVHGQRFQFIAHSIKGWWDRDAIRRVLENMIGNAIKYGDLDKMITVRSETVHERLLLSVHNEGAVIPAEEQESIFQIYRRARATKHEQIQGWGIGLSFVRSVAESHGGSVGVESTLENGTTFIIDIPVDARPFQNAPTLF